MDNLHTSLWRKQQQQKQRIIWNMNYSGQIVVHQTKLDLNAKLFIPQEDVQYYEQA
jgi:hypothetical protein